MGREAGEVESSPGTGGAGPAVEQTPLREIPGSWAAGASNVPGRFTILLREVCLDCVPSPLPFVFSLASCLPRFPSFGARPTPLMAPYGGGIPKALFL